jgi:tetratricopeptide (TPR) repeat protein
MESVFDIFQSVKTLLYLGNYQTACDEATGTDINEDDLSQVVKKYFYIFISCIEDQKTDELNKFMQSLKNVNNPQIKIYYNLFLFFIVYVFKNQFNEQKFTNLYNDLKDVKRFDPILFPAVYIISLMLLHRKEYENFLQLIDKFEQDLEILALKFYLFFTLNKVDEMEKVVNTLNIREQDSILTQICSILFNLYKKNDFDYAINNLQIINKNYKMTPKIFNFIGVSLMSKGAFEEAAKVLNFGKDACEKSGVASKDYHTVLVNLICCYRNLAKEDEVRNAEEILRKNDPKNNYFARVSLFDEEFMKVMN